MSASGKKIATTGDMVTDYCFSDLQVGFSGPVTIMVSRTWDCNNVNGRYLSTDYIFSDNRGNVTHATAKQNIAHHFVDKLKEGGVYVLKEFTVMPTRDEYMILKDGRFVIELHGSTVVRTSGGNKEGFVRHPFDLVQFEDLEVTGNKHFVDVVGYVFAVGSPNVKSNG